MREKSGRKSTWNHKETSTIRIPKVFELEVMRYARYLDAGLGLDNETDSSQGDDFVTESNLTLVDTINDEFEYEINSSLEAINALKTTDQFERVTAILFRGLSHAIVYGCYIPSKRNCSAEKVCANILS